MDHPLIRKDSTALNLRKRVVSLIQDGYSVPRNGNIIFVCGGNDAHHMRSKFLTFAKSGMPEYQIFFPEFAMKDYFSRTTIEPFDIADFEKLIGALSHAIVLFPEAPGSFAETGYFALQPDMVRKTVLALDADRQNSDSFISMGPANKFSASSAFRPIVQLSYANPNFTVLADRINRHHPRRTKKSFEVVKFKDMSHFDIFCLIQKIVSLLYFARIEDVVYMCRSIFGGHVSVPDINQITSILVGSGIILPEGDYGYYRCAKGKDILLEPRDGYASEETEIKLIVSEIIEKSDAEFQVMLTTV